MRTEIYTLEKENLDIFEGIIPSEITNNVPEPGYFTIGAVSKVDGEDVLMGLSQFYIDITSEGECFADLMYVYVLDDYREQGIGLKLVEKVNSILKKSDVKSCFTRISKSVKDEALLSMDAITSFLKECSFIPTKEVLVGETLPFPDDKDSKKFIRLTRR